MIIDRRTLWIAAAIFIISLAFFLFKIQFPVNLNFDEFGYIPAVREFLALGKNRNWEHPPLAKYLMTLGVLIGGDRPFGWRLMSAVFGALSLSGIYILALVWFKNETAAFWTTLVTAFNQMHYVQSRIAMLDTFMMTFIIWTLIPFSLSWNPNLTSQESKRYLNWTGVVLGLALACKWFSVILWATLIGLVGLIFIFHHWQTQFKKPVLDSAGSWYDSRLYQGVKPIHFLISLGVIPLIVYFATFPPLLLLKGENYRFLDIFKFPYEMWSGQQRVGTSHPYKSTWTQWIFMTRPIWYAFDHQGKEFVRGVIFLGNPLIMWGGLLGILYSVYAWIKNQSLAAFFILIFYSAFLFSWAIIPRTIAFYYYYYPAGMILGFACILPFKDLLTGSAVRKTAVNPMISNLGWGFVALSLGFFAFFFPILSATKILHSSYTIYMWLNSWI